MKQYLDLLEAIKEKGTYKAPARENMPGTTSVFGYQFRHNLADGFPLLTTKKMYWKGVVVELLWFLRGDTNIKYLIDNGVNIWNQDAYNYYCKLREKHVSPDSVKVNFNHFIEIVKDKGGQEHTHIPNYKWGDCGRQYGKVWRDWDAHVRSEKHPGLLSGKTIDQIKSVIESLKNSPSSRRHIVTAIDPIHDQDLALYWCHAMFQFNCRPMTNKERNMWWDYRGGTDWTDKGLDEKNVPKYYLDCQLYQRSADVFLGVPFNIASYALMTELFARMCNMVPGEFIHTFGDVHIYDNHMDAVNEQLGRFPEALPTLSMNPMIDKNFTIEDINVLGVSDFYLRDYNPQPSIKAELSTGLVK